MFLKSLNKFCLSNSYYVVDAFITLSNCIEKLVLMLCYALSYG